MTAAVLLDVDGTLVDTNYLHAICWAEALAQQGFEVSTARLHRLIGMESTRLVKEVGAVAEDVTPAHRALYAQHWGHLRPLPGARELLRKLHERGRVVLASSASQQELAALKDALDADDWIDDATSGDDVDSGKPAPDLLERAVELAGTRDVVMVGDSVWDAEASARAGIPFVGLLCGGTDERTLRDAGAVEVWQDPRELVAGLSTSIITAHERGHDPLEKKG